MSQEEDERDWGDILDQSFQGAAAQATAATFDTKTKSNNKNKEMTDDNTDTKSVYVNGYRVSPDWTSSIWVFLFTTLIYGGFVALHCVRIFEKKEDTSMPHHHSSSNSTNTTNTTTTTTIPTTTTTASPSSHNDDDDLPLADHKVLLGIVSIAVTFLAYLWTVVNMFLAVFTNPGILLRRHEIIAREQDSVKLGSGSDEQNDDANANSNNDENEALLGRDPSSPLQSGENSLGLEGSGALSGSGGGKGVSRSSAASTASSIVFASNKNHALARGSVVRNSTAKPGDLLSNDDGVSTAGGLLHAGSKDDATQEYVKINNIDIPTPYCTTCHIRRPVRASHCVHCQNCVLGFDHHCGVIGCCVGHFNIRYFTGFVWGIGVLSWLVGISSALVAVSERYDEQNKKFVISLGFCAICLILGLQLGCNLGGHYWCLFRRGFTHREWVKRDLLYGGRSYHDGYSPFRADSCCRQCSYLWCPPAADANLKAWAEGNDDEIFPPKSKYFGGKGESVYKNISKPYGFLPHHSASSSNANNNNRIISPRDAISATQQIKSPNVTSPLLLKSKSGEQHQQQTQQERSANSTSPLRIEKSHQTSQNETSPQSAVSLDTMNGNSVSRQRRDNGNSSALSDDSHHTGISTSTSEQKYHLASTTSAAKHLNISSLDATNQNHQEQNFPDYGATSPTSNYNAL